MEMLFKDGRPRHFFFISEAFWEPQSISGDAGRRIRAPPLCHQRVQTNQGERPPPQQPPGQSHRLSRSIVEFLMTLRLSESGQVK